MNLRTKLVKGTPNKAAIYEEDEPFAKNDMSHDPLITTQTIKAREEGTLVEQAQSIKGKLSARKTQQIKSGLKVQPTDWGAPNKFPVKNNKNESNQIKNTVKLLSPFLVAGDHPNIEKEEIAVRRAYDEPKAKSMQSNKKRRIVYGLAHVKAFMSDSSQAINQSIEYLAILAGQNQLSKRARNTLRKCSIIPYFRNLFMGGNNSFYKYSTELLNNHLHKIIQDFRQSQLNRPPQIKIQIQILSQFFKILLQSQQYLPSDSKRFPLHLKLTAMAQVLKLPLKQCNQLRKIYFQHYPEITYLEQNYNIRPLVNTYYFILLKKKAILEASSEPPREEQYNKVAKQLQAYKRQANEKARQNKEIKDKHLLSVLYANRSKTQKVAGESKESLEMIQNYEKLLSSSNLKQTENRKKEKFINICGHNADYSKFKRYQLRKRKLLQRYGNDLIKLKDVLITKELIRDTNCSYEEVFDKTYHYYKVYIERDYFEGNVHRLLAKETHYQQLRYLERVLKGADLCKQRATVCFVDCCNLTNRQESKVFIAVTLDGKLFCSKFRGNMCILEDTQQFLKGSKPSIVILFNDQFPFSSELQQTGLFDFRKLHTLLFLPRVSLAPSLCTAIANSLRAAFSSKLNQSCDQKEILQTVLREFEPRVKEIVEKEWEKVQRFVDPNVHPLQQENGVIIKMEEDQESESSPEVCYKRSEYVKEEDEMSEESQLQEGLLSTHFPRSQCKEEIGASSSHILPENQIMENLKGRSTNDLRLALTQLLKLNKDNLFRKFVQNYFNMIDSYY